MPRKTKLNPETRRMLRLTGRFASVGLEMGICVVLGYLIGWKLDQWLETDPYLTIFWIVVGFGAAFKAVFDAYREAKKDL